MYILLLIIRGYKLFKYSKHIIIIWCLSLAIIITGSLNSVTSPPSEYHLDKIIHFGAFAFLASLLPFFITNTKILIACLVALISVGLGIEIIQAYIPNRDGSCGDFIANMLGAITGCLCATFLLKKLRR